jgi:hypothetical protein
MSKHISAAPSPPEAARNAQAAQDRSDKWQPLQGTVPVTFMKHQTGMCRWPIGDPHRLEQFRFCGCACSAADTYCETHRQMAFNPNRARAPFSGSTRPAFPIKVA